jgi:hypothetical protein
MTSTSRSLQHSWDTAWATAPPPSCQTLRNLNNAVAYGQTCVFAEEDGDPTPFNINTACLPWVTSGVYPSTSAFYSPATACPDSWTAVATQTSASNQKDWVDGETALQCCPDGMVGDGRVGCRPGSSGSWPVVECGEADAEENEQRTYLGASWPASATPSITALQLRYQPSDVGSANPTASETGRTSTSGTGGSGGGGKSSNGGAGGGLSTGATAAIATVIPLAFIIGALAAFLLWRRKSRNRKTTLLASEDLGDEKARRASGSSTQHPTSDPKAPSTAAAAYTTGTAHETPEWNIEMNATEAERQKLVNAYDQAPMSASTTAGGSEAAELGGMARVSRKPIAPVEIDSTEVRAEIGDAYLPYRPGAEGK